jgi:nucleoid DNA-binding protein
LVEKTRKNREKSRIPLGWARALPYIPQADRSASTSTNTVHRTHMAKTTKKVAPKKAAKTAAKPAAPKPIKEALTKSGLVAHIAESSGVAPKDVRAVMAALQSAIQGSVSKKGAGTFTLPGLLKIKTVSVPAKPKRKGINPFTKEEQWFAAKPASTKLKATFMKTLKDSAAA